AARKLRARHETDARWVHRLTVAVHFVMEVRAGRKSGRADVADYLPAAHTAAVSHRNAAHVRIAGGKTTAVRQLDVVAVAAVAPGVLDGAVAGRMDRRAIARLEVEPGMHPAIAEDRMAAHAVSRADPAGHRRHQAGALLAHARRLVELAVVAPPKQLLARLSAPHDGRVEQFAGFDFAGRRPLVFDDQFEHVAAGYASIEVDLSTERAQILLHRSCRSARGPGRAVKARADHAANAKRGRVDPDRARIERE